MTIIQAVILGVVEGITEFLPISSTFHLIFASTLLKISQNDFTKLFEVFIQSGAILSVALLFFTDVVKYKELVKRVLVSFLPTAIVGLVLYTFIKEVLFENQIFMVGIFALVGVVFLLVERLIKKDKIILKRDMQSLTYKEAIIIGLVQSLAVLPGVSRAGAVIIAMMLLHFKRDKAAYYSFLLSVPTVFAASFLDLYKMRDMISNYSTNWILLGVGFISAFVSSYFVVKWLIRFLQRNTLEIFGFYRIVLAIILSVLFLK
ncbi:hypothetical protein A2866_06055 [Candidatus Roizmanbacteria bacterium RIFCSPHIGHO2_01_FULL_39_8]|uniref:Undecaprenyl-diphosphatase n=2 Tax=Candidatus Roizmaniibacteriota TaxID=1752723 RepID=A0A1F7GSY7_9BACT|nr:MAG: hypothetical protein A2866_06055 [Candidatus Roizmanbacteria bacterium RIFCSPHIGHO2_01_FULL_39_8]